MPSTIHLFIAADLPAGLAMHPGPDVMPPGDIVVLPSTLHRRDRSAAAVRDWLRTYRLRSHLLTPESLVAATLVRRSSAWRRIYPSGGPPLVPGQIALPRRLTDARAVWTVSDIDEVAGRGPYILDLPIRYMNATARAMMFGSRHRSSIAVSLLRTLSITNHVISRRYPGFTLIATTSDPIAAELLSLALVDEQLAHDSEVIGPWEDDFVQRATELELGVRLPAEITMAVQGIRHPAVVEMLGRITARMGMDSSQLTHVGGD